MEKFKRILRRAFCPGAAIVVLCVIAATAALVWAFAVAPEGHPLVYAAYVFSAYALALLCVNVVPFARRLKAWMQGNRYVGRYMADIPFKVSVSLFGALGINLLYTLLNALYGAMYHSWWYVTLSAYYCLLAVIRFLLIRYAHRQGLGASAVGEWRRYRLCGILLVPLGVVLVGMVLLVMNSEGGFTYAGTLIFAMAAYAFYAITMAVINVIKYRKYRSPVMSAARVMSLASALVSMLALEVAMLEQFGTQEEENFKSLMIVLSGCAVFALLFGMGVYMIIHSTRALRLEEGGRDNV